VASLRFPRGVAGSARPRIHHAPPEMALRSGQHELRNRTPPRPARPGWGRGFDSSTTHDNDAAAIEAAQTVERAIEAVRGPVGKSWRNGDLRSDGALLIGRGFVLAAVVSEG
jgi:hypothetical protein